MKRILLLGGDTRALYGLIRFFHSAHVEVLVGDCGIRSIVSSTRLAQYVYIPTHVGDVESYIVSYLARLTGFKEVDAIFPVTDQAYWRLYNANLPDQIAQKLISYTKDQYRNLSNKSFVHPLAAKCFDVPQLVESIEPNTQYIVKEPVSFRAENLAERGGVRKIIGREISEHDKGSLVYECLEGGQGAGIGLVVSEGKILSAFAHKRLEENNLAGSAIRQEIEIPADMLAQTEKFAQVANLNGLNMIEFKIIKERWYFIELNPRPWGSLPLYLSRPAFAEAVAKFFGVMSPCRIASQPNKIQVNLVKSARNQPKGLLRMLPRLGRLAFDEIGPEENLPFRFMAHKVRAWFSFRIFQASQLVAPRGTANIKAEPTFVCFGNINRSALAGVVFRQCGQSSSCGTIEKSGRPKSSQLREYLQQYGMPGDGVSCPFDPEAPVFVIFDRFIYEDLVFKLGVDRSRIRLLSLRQIPDPHGQSKEAYRRVFSRIWSELEKD